MKKVLNDELLIDYLEGRCNSEQLEEINEYLALSEENARELFELEAIHSGAKLREFSSPDYLNLAEKKLLDRIELNEVKRTRQLRRARHIRIARRVTAAISAAVIGLVVLFSSGVLEPRTITLAVGKGEPIREFVLPDGSKVWVNEGSFVTYNASFPKKDRTVEMGGEAYFSVRKDSGKPFVVNSPLASVRVLGTEFNMKAGDGICEVTLIEGQLQVRGARDEGQVILNTGQKAVVDSHNKKLSVFSVNGELDAVWRDKLIPFNHSSLADIARTLEYLYGVKIFLAPNISIKSRYSGEIEMKEDIADVLKALKIILPVEFTMTGDSIIVSPK